MGIDSATGPGRPVRNRWNAPWIAPGISAPLRRPSAQRLTGRKHSIWFGTSWSAPTSWPTSGLGMSDMMSSTGWEPAWASTSGVSAFVAPGPVVTTTTPGRPDARA